MSGCDASPQERRSPAASAATASARTSARVRVLVNESSKMVASPATARSDSKDRDRMMTIGFMANSRRGGTGQDSRASEPARFDGAGETLVVPARPSLRQGPAGRAAAGVEHDGVLRHLEECLS